jgi:hypothetical protein
MEAGSRSSSKGEKAGTNVWDAAIAVIVVGGLVVLVIYLVGEYGTDTEKIAGVLGVAAPVLAGAFGVTLGYFTGTKKGEATGEKTAKRELKAAIAPLVETLEDDLDRGVLQPMTTALESPAGARSFSLPGGQGQQASIDQTKIDNARAAVAKLRGVVDSPV